VDYQGRPWTTAPSGVRPETSVDSHDCFIPTKCIKKFTGHTKGVQAIEFFPGTGHLLLSASMDGKCKIWDVYEDRNVRRTYAGHTEAVRSINLGGDGSQFLSSGFDRYIRLWDVETGQAKGTFSNRKMGYQVKFYPRDNNLFIVAASDNKIYQWDARSGSVVQEYNYHLQPCSTVTFFDDGRKFVSTSDDKKILVWEFDIPVPILYIQDPSMHAVPYVALHPSKTAFAGQSMDNSIVTYQCGEKVSIFCVIVFGLLFLQRLLL
jgi:pre-mRNA-processing factor 17